MSAPADAARAVDPSRVARDALFAFEPTPDGARLASPPPLFAALARAPRDAFADYALELRLPAGAAAAFAVARAAGALAPAEDRAVGCLLGMAVGDAVGAPVEFMVRRLWRARPRARGAAALARAPARAALTPPSPQDYRPGGLPLSTDGGDSPLAGADFFNTFRLKPGQWTDDASMGLCLADSLIACGFTFSPLDALLRFTAWWHGGYNNAFRADRARARGRGSVGLGGTIGAALDAFLERGDAATRTGGAQSSGNGTLMRLAAVPVCFHADEAAAAAAARASARTTHAGDEAAEAAALLAALVARAIHAPGTDAAARKEALWDGLAAWETPSPGVRALARAAAEPLPGGGGAPDPDRDWRWRGPARLDFSPKRAAAQPGYVGSYAMDALAMALHCVASTADFRGAVLAAANLRGDADTVAAIAGQIAGAVYGAAGIPAEWVAKVERWDGGGSIALRAHCLFAREG